MATGLNLRQLFTRHTSTVVEYSDGNVLGRAQDSNGGARGSGVAMNVCQALLYQTEYHEFQVSRNSAKVFRHVELNIQSAAMFQAFDVPVECRKQAGFVEKRWMQQVRRGADLGFQLPKNFSCVVRLS